MQSLVNFANAAVGHLTVIPNKGEIVLYFEVLSNTIDRTLLIGHLLQVVILVVLFTVLLLQGVLSCNPRIIPGKKDQALLALLVVSCVCVAVVAIC